MTPFDELDLLRVYIRILESGSISAAARSLRMPQPTLSRHLRTLEDRAGTTLLVRDTHRMKLTEAGHRLFADARAMLTLAEDATNRLREERAELHGHLRVFSTVDFGQTAVSRVLARFLLAHPQATAELVYSNRPVQMIEDGHDAAVIAGEVTDENVVARRVGTIERFVVGSPRYLSTTDELRDPDDIAHHRWLSLPQRQFGGPVDSVALFGPRNARRTIRTKPVLVMEGVTGLREAVHEGLGVCVLPRWLVRDDLASGALMRVLPDWSANPLPLSVIHLAQRASSVRVRAFIDFLATEMAAELHARSFKPPRR
ncbi:MAG: LysR family transcriptional regulator [Polyangiaceae bacterium]|nr:LysR family transcriptional regulator [Polyangiaceae bacterium]